MWQSPVASSGNDDLTDTKSGANKALKQKNIILKNEQKHLWLNCLRTKITSESPVGLWLFVSISIWFW